jgi:mRNA interferase RelE/StbE
VYRFERDEILKKQELPPILSNQSRKYLASQDRKTKQRIKEAIEGIPNGDILPMENSEGSYRLRKGGFRVIFSWRGNNQIAIEKIQSRGKVYKGG